MKKLMMLWLVEWPKDGSEDYPQYTYFDKLLVAAHSAEEAAQFVPENPVSYSSCWAKDPSVLKVEFVGIAKAGQEYGLVIGSFNQA